MNAGVRLIDRLSSGQDHFIFAGIFVLGSLWVIVTRVLLDVGVFWAVLVPLSLLFLYAWILWQPQYRLREDRAGDNLYYLGFLFTVVSLGIALYRYDGNEHNVDSIINDLGVGLSTTVVGLFLRIFYSQLRIDPEEVGSAARVELTRGLQQFASDVRQMNEIVRATQHGLGQHVEESSQEFKKLLDSTAAVISDVNSKFSSIEIPASLLVDRVNQSFSVFDVALQEVSERINRESIDLSPINNQIAESSKSIEAAITGLVGNIHDIDIEQGNIFKSFSETVTSVEESLKGLPSGITEANVAIGEQLTLVKGSINSLSDQAAQLELVSKNNAAAASSIGEMTVNIQELLISARELSSVNQTLHQISTSLRDNNSVSTQISQLSTQLSEARAETEVLTDSVVKIASEFSNSMTRLVEATDQAIQGK